MGRVEENKAMLEHLSEELKSEELVRALFTNQNVIEKVSMASIASVLEDISISLAVIADSMQQKETAKSDE